MTVHHRTAETTNVLLRRLTFLSMLLGGMAALAGLLGMDFQPPFAKALASFWIVVAALAVAAAAGLTLARLRKWI